MLGRTLLFILALKKLPAGVALPEGDDSSDADEDRALPDHEADEWIVHARGSSALCIEISVHSRFGALAWEGVNAPRLDGSQGARASPSQQQRCGAVGQGKRLLALLPHLTQQTYDRGHTSRLRGFQQAQSLDRI